ncbi:MAG TPA: Gfo/Idh/MocA family oxidoreductase [Chthoniobacterales bacterium]|nr:Gfo/Idh/MocA family oxidoreductase [Chthoniobacterales bacterium]
MSSPHPSNSEVRIGILGSGWMGLVHAECYQRIKGVKVVGVFSRNQERAEAAAKICGARAVLDVSALLDDPKVDAIDVCLPSANHEEFVVKVLERGKHVFCETPFALKFTEAETMLKAANNTDRLFMVGLLERSIAQYEYVHQAAAAGHLGKVRSITAYRLGSYLLSEESRKHYADPALELMTPDFDFVRWLIGPPATVSATASWSGLACEAGGRKEIVPGEISAILTYDSGVHAAVIASGIMPKGFPFSIGFRVLFEKGALEQKTVFEGAGPPKNTFQLYSDDGVQTLTIEEHDPYEHELRYFVEAIRGEADSSFLAAHHAGEALRLSLATLQSAKENQVIRLAASPPMGKQI